MTTLPEPIRFSVTIVNKRGLHARASSKFAKLASQFESDIIVEHNGMEVPASSVMGLLTLGAGRGKKIFITCSGSDADQASDALTELVIRGFDEDDNDGT